MTECSIGIDLGGTRVKIGVVCENNIVDKIILPAQSAKGLAANLPFIQHEIDQLLKRNNIAESTLKGIGLGFPGLVNYKSKKILSTNAKYDDALNIDLDSWVKNRWNTDFFIDNDARMAAVGEWKYGEGKNTDDLVVITIGTGIGTSAIIEGKLLRGRHFQAGCLGGHFSVQYNGRKCTCGNLGCMEAYASTWSVKERITAAENYTESILAAETLLDFETLFQAAEQQDELAMKLKEDCFDIWASGIVSLIHAYDPEVVVIGGGVMNNKDNIMPFLIPKIHQHAWCPWGKVDIRSSRLMSDAGIYGAVYCLEHEV